MLDGPVLATLTVSITFVNLSIYLYSILLSEKHDVRGSAASIELP